MADKHPHSGPLLWSLDETVARLGIGRSTLYRLFTNGQITPIHIGSRTLVPGTEIDAFIARKRASATQSGVTGRAS